MAKNNRKKKDIGSRRCNFFIWLVLSLGSLCFHSIVWADNNMTVPETGPVTLEQTRENLAIKLVVNTYSLRKQKLGDDAPEGSIFLILRGSLINLSAGERTSVPDVQKAFFLLLNGESIVDLHPISEDTADPFWGPVILEPGEELPLEMVFAVPDWPIDQAKLMHLSNMGPINLYIIGEAPTPPSTYLAGPVSKGLTRLAVERIDFDQSLSGTTPTKEWHYIRIYYWFTNLRPLQPLETDLAGLAVLVEDGHYVYPPVTESRSRDLLQGETFYAQEPTAGEIVFMLPEKTGDLAFVHFTEDGPLALDLTPNIGALAPQKPVAGPVGVRSISLSLFQPQHAIKLDSPKAGFRYVVLDVGLRLNFDSSIASFAFKPATSLELHDNRGNFYKPENIAGRLRRPLGPSDVWRDQIVRGEVAFLVPSKASSFTLMIPFNAGPTKLPVPKTLLSLPTATTALKRLPEHSASPQSKASKPQQPVPKAKENETAKVDKSSKRTIEEELNSRGYKDLMVVVRDDGVGVVVGVMKNNTDIDEVSSLVNSFPQVKEVKIHISTVPAQKLHPLKLKKWVDLAMKAVGLTGVQLRMRKRDELILLGTVANDEEEKMALSIARIMINNVVNLLKKPDKNKR